MVHGVRLQGGKALWYRNRWIRSTAVSAALGEPPAPGPRAERFDTVNTNVLGHAGQTWAIVEAGGFPVRIDEELNTIAHDPFGGTLALCSFPPIRISIPTAERCTPSATRAMCRTRSGMSSWMRAARYPRGTGPRAARPDDP
jgi:hypothetical protein